MCFNEFATIQRESSLPSTYSIKGSATRYLKGYFSFVFCYVNFNSCPTKCPSKVFGIIYLFCTNINLKF